MKKSHIFILILVAAGVRLAPALWTGMPYSMDAWPMISGTEKILEHSPLSLSSKILSGYGNFWPGSRFFGVMLSELTSLSPVTSLAIGVPLANSIAVLIFYAIVDKLTNNTNLAFLSGFLLAVAFPLIHFRASVTKETFSIALFMFLVLLYLKKGDKKTLLLSIPVSIALAASHHFTPLIVLTVLGIASIVIGLRRFLEGKTLPLKKLAIPAILASLFALYYLSFAHEASFFLPDLPYWISAGAYLIAGLAAASYLTKDKRKVFSILIVAGFLGLGFAATMISLTSGAPVLPSNILLYSSFLLLSLPIGVMGYWKLQEEGHSAFALAWIASIIAIILYTLFGASRGAFPVSGYGMAYRGLYFFTPPLCIFSAAGILYVYRSSFSLSKIFAISLTIIAIVVSLSAYYISLTGGGRYMGYQALQTEGEFEASDWITKENYGPIAGDQKTFYLLSLYRGEKVNMRKGYTYLTGQTEKQPQTLYIYDQMYRNGYLIGLYGRELPENWPERTEEMDLIYYNDLVKIYRRV